MLKENTMVGNFQEILNCPKDQGKLNVCDGNLTCSICGAVYHVDDNIPVFNEKRGYWSNATRETMRDVIQETIAEHDWKTVMKRKIPDYERHIAPYFRGDISALLPISSGSVVLDAGSMWGGLTIPFSQKCKQIFAVDQTWESLRYLAARASIDDISNIIPIESTIAKLPFSDQKFDLILLNGVLEWVATDDEVVLERDWNKSSGNIVAVSGAKTDPRLLQLNVLEELARTLSENGSLYIAIENRIGLQYFAGYPDDHVNVRFVSFLPRSIANLVTKFIKGTEYRTYLYSPRQLKKLLNEAGFRNVELYTSFPHYNIISRMVNFENFDSLKSIPLDGSAPLNKSGKIKVALFGLAWRLIPNPIRKHFTPSIGVIATKGTNPVPWLVQELYDSSVLKNKDYSLILCNNRFSDDIPSNILILNNKTSDIEMFCKVGRKLGTNTLQNENETLTILNNLRNENGLILNGFPNLIYHGTLDGFEVQVTKFEKILACEPFVASGIMKAIPADLNGRKISISQVLRKYSFNRWVKQTSGTMSDALIWLNNFNKLMGDRYISQNSDLIRILYSDLSHEYQDLNVFLDQLKQKLSNLEIGKVPLGIEHGDFDLCNIFRTKDGKIFVVDFEHSEFEKTPFFDIGTLLFSTLAREWRSANTKYSLKKFSDALGYTDIIKSALTKYSLQTDINVSLLEYMPGLAVVTLLSKKFPSSRDMNDYPLYHISVLRELLNWKIELVKLK